jgi:hypothetical protein
VADHAKQGRRVVDLDVLEALYDEARSLRGVASRLVVG